MNECKHIVFNDDGLCQCGAKKLVYVNEWETVADFGPDGIDADDLLQAVAATDKKGSAEAAYLPK